MSKPRYRLDHGRMVPIRRLPYGFAVGCFDLNSRGKAWGAAVTVWPSTKPHPLFTGGEGSRPVLMVRGTPLWKQEMYVYLLERKEVCWAALKDLEKAFCTPRVVGHREVDPTPYPEDFEETGLEGKFGLRKAAALIGCTYAALYSYCLRGLVKPEKIGCHWYLSPVELKRAKSCMGIEVQPLPQQEIQESSNA